MDEQDTVDAPEAVVAAPAADPTPISDPAPVTLPESPPEAPAAAVAEAVVAAEVAEPAPVAVEPEAEPWVGEVSKLNDLGWYKELPPHQRRSLQEGLSNVRKNMDRAFHQKSAEIKAQREALDSREKLILGIARGDLDANQTIDEAVEAKLTERLADMTAELTSLKENRADPAEIAEAKAARDALQATLDEIQTTYQQAAEELEVYREQSRLAQKARLEKETDATIDYIEKHAPDLFENEAALDRFIRSDDYVEGDFETALKYVRLKFPAPKTSGPAKKEVKPAEKVPDAMGMMGKGAPLSEGNAGGRTVHSRYNPIDDVDAEIRRLRIAAGH